MKNHFFQLDVLRAIAIILVVVYHYSIYASIIPGWNGLVLNGGHIGVSIFFVISGMLISKPFVVNKNNKAPDIKRYIINRVVRIVPLFWLTSTVFFILKNHIALYYNNPTPISIVDYLRFYLFDYNDLVRLNPPLWTLKFEIIFYIFFPLAFLISRKGHQFIRENIYGSFIVVCLFFMLYRTLYIHYLKVIPEYDFINNLETFLLGVLLSFFIFNNTKKAYFKYKFPVLIPAVLILITANFKELPVVKGLCYYPLFQGLFDVLIFLLFVGLLQSPSTIKSKLVIKIITTVSLISYSIYLWHFNIYYNLVMPLLKKGLHHPNHILIALLSVGISITLSIITYYGFEKQFLRLKAQQ